MVTREEKPLQSPQETKNKTLKEGFRFIKDNITVEPVLACYVISGSLSLLASQNLKLDKACRSNLGYSNDVCDALVAQESDKYLKEELRVQELAASVESWRNIILTAIPSFLILFYGAWSDRTGNRKICIILPIIGDFLSCLSNIVNVYYFKEIPVEGTAFFEAFFSAVVGGWIVMYMGVYSYLSDASSEDNRTFRIGIATFIATVGDPLGSLFGGILLNAIGYYGVFGLASILYLFSIIYGIFYIHNPEKSNLKNKNKDNYDVWKFLRSFFDVNQLKNVVKVIFKKGHNHRRTKIVLVLLSVCFVFGCYYGELVVRYMFTRYRFKWDVVKYSFYGFSYECFHAIGALISVTIFSRYWKWDDSVLGIVSTVSKLIGVVAIVLAKNTVQMYIAVVIETFNATSLTALRSILSKSVSSDELGKALSLFNLTEVLASMIFSPAYAWIYMVTLQIDARCFYYFSILITLPTIAFFGWFFYRHRKTRRAIKRHTEDLEVPELKKEGLEDKPLLKSETSYVKELI